MVSINGKRILEGKYSLNVDEMMVSRFTYKINMWEEKTLDGNERNENVKQEILDTKLPHKKDREHITEAANNIIEMYDDNRNSIGTKTAGLPSNYAELNAQTSLVCDYLSGINSDLQKYDNSEIKVAFNQLLAKYEPHKQRRPWTKETDPVQNFFDELSDNKTRWLGL